METNFGLVQCLLHFFLGGLIAFGLFYNTPKRRNPLKWPGVDRALLAISLLYLLAGLIPLLSTGLILFPNTSGHHPLGLWRRSFYAVMSVGEYWILLLAFSLWLYRNPPNRKNPLEWQTVDRTLLLIWVFFFVGGIERLENFLFSEGHLPPWINPEFAVTLRPLYHLESAFVLIMLLTGLWLRQTRPENRIFPHVVIQYAALSNAFNAYIFGPLTNANGFLGGMALGAATLLLFRPAIALPGVGTFMTFTVGSTILAGTGVIPYAPQLAGFPVQNGRISPSFLVSSLTWTTIVFLLVMSLMTYILIRWRQRESKLAEMTALLKKMFGRYISTEVMNTLMENPSSLELGGERRRVTIMMTDLRGFTALSERLEPEQVVTMLNAYFEVMVDIVLQYHGTINEIIGDALLVVFGAPRPVENRTQRAVACAIAMQNAMAKVNTKNRQDGLPEIEMGIGLNESEVILGNIGSSKRSKYAVVGRGVNLASRIESYTVGGQVLISESVRREAGHVLRIDAQRQIQPKGSESTLFIYEVGGIGGEYHLALEKKDPVLKTLLHSVPVMCTPLDGKKVTGKGVPGSLLQLSERSAILNLSEPLKTMMNIKLNLSEAPGKLAQRDFYGKIMALLQEDGKDIRIRFTSIPPEVDAYFQALLQYGIFDA